MKKIVISSLLLTLGALSANGSFDMNETINVDGLYSQKQESAKDRLKKLRKKLEKQNELLVQRKIEEMRLRQIMAETKKLQRMFNENMERLDSIQ